MIEWLLICLLCKNLMIEHFPSFYASIHNYNNTECRVLALHFHINSICCIVAIVTQMATFQKQGLIST